MTTLTREKTETASEPIDRRVLVAKLAALEQAEAAENEADRKTWPRSSSDSPIPANAISANCGD